MKNSTIAIEANIDNKNIMKIAILTLPLHANYGGILQAVPVP